MRISAQGISFGFDARTGLLDGFTVTDGGREIAPLHRAPWVGTDQYIPPDEPPLIATLGGDFFCAPFALKTDSMPLHGFPPNTEWQVVSAGGGVLRAVLKRTVEGAMLAKEMSVEDGHPFVYQRHVFMGGEGRLSFANHANVSLPNGGLIRTSPKSHWETPAAQQEPDPSRGRSALKCPAKTGDPRTFPSVNGTSDLTTYPWNPRHEDFVIGVEARGHWLGWTAVTRPSEGDLYLALRNARAMPMSMFWHSNGGRDYPPWNGRHVACLGTEEGAALHMLGISSEADLAGPGALTLTPGGVATVLHAIGAIDWPSGEPVSSVEPGNGAVTVVGEGGARRTVPCRTGLLEG
jgi:hypothetical protein